MRFILSTVWTAVITLSSRIWQAPQCRKTRETSRKRGRVKLVVNASFSNFAAPHKDRRYTYAEASTDSTPWKHWGKCFFQEMGGRPVSVRDIINLVYSMILLSIISGPSVRQRFFPASLMWSGAITAQSVESICKFYNFDADIVARERNDFLAVYQPMSELIDTTDLSQASRIQGHIAAGRETTAQGGVIQ